MKRLTVSIALVAFICSTALAQKLEQNWPQFRGPGATGVVEGSPQPVKWDASKQENVRWKLAIPGLSHSSPVVWGNKVFVMTAVSSGTDQTRFGLYGDVAPVKDDPKHTYKVYAIDKQKGTILWERVTFDGNTIFHGTSTVLSAYGAPMPFFAMSLRVESVMVT